MAPACSTGERVDGLLLVERERVSAGAGTNVTKRVPIKPRRIFIDVVYRDRVQCDYHFPETRPIELVLLCPGEHQNDYGEGH